MVSPVEYISITQHAGYFPSMTVDGVLLCLEKRRSTTFRTKIYVMSAGDGAVLVEMTSVVATVPLQPCLQMQSVFTSR